MIAESPMSRPTTSNKILIDDDSCSNILGHISMKKNLNYMGSSTISASKSEVRNVNRDNMNS